MVIIQEIEQKKKPPIGSLFVMLFVWYQHLCYRLIVFKGQFKIAVVLLDRVRNTFKSDAVMWLITL